MSKLTAIYFDMSGDVYIGEALARNTPGKNRTCLEHLIKCIDMLQTILDLSMMYSKKLKAYEYVQNMCKHVYQCPDMSKTCFEHI